MKTYYYTLDNCADVIAQNATIKTIEAEDQDDLDRKLFEIAEKVGVSDEDFEAVITLGRFGDCWVKDYSNRDPFDIEPFRAEDLSFNRPGSHPGGNCTWITPVPDVYLLTAFPRFDGGL